MSFLFNFLLMLHAWTKTMPRVWSLWNLPRITFPTTKPRYLLEPMMPKMNNQMCWRPHHTNVQDQLANLYSFCTLHTTKGGDNQSHWGLLSAKVQEKQLTNLMYRIYLSGWVLCLKGKLQNVFNLCLERLRPNGIKPWSLITCSSASHNIQSTIWPDRKHSAEFAPECTKAAPMQLQSKDVFPLQFCYDKI